MIFDTLVVCVRVHVRVSVLCVCLYAYVVWCARCIVRCTNGLLISLVMSLSLMLTYDTLERLFSSQCHLPAVFSIGGSLFVRVLASWLTLSNECLIHTGSWSTHANLCDQMHMYTHTHIYACSHKHTSHTHMHIHTQTHVFSPTLISLLPPSKVYFEAEDPPQVSTTSLLQRHILLPLPLRTGWSCDCHVTAWVSLSYRT